MDPLTLPVAEVFGPVFQGEGPATGQRCSFLRLGQCNLACDWCDTPYTWDTTRYDLNVECPPTPPETLIAALYSHRTDHLVLTGGEPLIHAKNPALTMLLAEWPGTVDVETNGTIPPPRWLTDRLRLKAISPKVNTSDPVRRRIRKAALREWSQVEGAFLKVVCSTEADVRQAFALAGDTGWDTDRVWIMPEGVTGTRLVGTAHRLAALVADLGGNLTLRQHILVHGDTRGT